MQLSNRMEIAPRVETLTKDEGRYLYCVADSGERLSLREIGIGGNETYTIPYQDICAVVHNCFPEPYQSDDPEIVQAWVIAHHQVVDAAWQRWGTVLPLSFGTIVKGEAISSAEGKIQEWLKQEYDRLKNKMNKVRGKVEYGVQVFWQPTVVAESLVQTIPEIRKLEEEVKSKPRGLAYMYRQRLENLVKRAMETRADECFKDFYSRIRKHADDIRVEKTKKAEHGQQMIMNISCLVNKESYAELGKELDQIKQMDGFSVRFTGPWPPYSFVGG